MHVGYVLKKFPRNSETFILNEILALQRAGVQVTVVDARPPVAEGAAKAARVAGIDRMVRANVLATSGRAVEAAGDIDAHIVEAELLGAVGNPATADANLLARGGDLTHVRASLYHCGPRHRMPDSSAPGVLH